jgi:murein DD-endopeptidase MepM/ murein hydrolase activator NlpD
MRTWGYIAILLVIALGVVLLYRKLMIRFTWPVEGRVTSPFGNRTHPVTGAVNSFHNGIDIAAPIGTSIYAPMRGTVMSVFTTDGGGLSLILQHPNGWRTGYAHLNRVLVAMGEEVIQGEVIAEVGNTGRSTGPHLHFTMRNASGQYVDPQPNLA